MASKNNNTNTNTNPAKVTTAAMVKVVESTTDNPVAFVRSFVVKNHKRLGRAGCVRELVTKHGIAYYTARTQYQRVHAMGYKLPTKAKVAPKAPAAKVAAK